MKQLIWLFSAVLILSSCSTQRGYVYEGGKKRKVKQWEVKHLQAQKGLRNNGRSCSEEW